METNKKARVVMLSTDSPQGFSIAQNNEGKLFTTVMTPKAINTTYQHLYLITDEEMNVGDYGLVTSQIMSYSDMVKEWEEPLGRKIISTTDTSLNLPQPSKAFIDKYVERHNAGDPIEEVMVEYEIDPNMKGNVEDLINRCLLFQEDPMVLKVDSHNTITIHPVKDSWSRDEHIKDIKEFGRFILKATNRVIRKRTNIKPLDSESGEQLLEDLLRQWIKDNL